MKDITIDTYARIKWMNIPWVDGDLDNAGFLRLSPDGNPSISACSTTNNGVSQGTATITYSWATGSDSDGLTNPTVQIVVTYNNAGNFWVNVTVAGASNKRVVVPLYVDWEINPAGTAWTDGGDDGIQFNAGASNANNRAQQRTESDLIGGKPNENNKYYITEASDAGLYGYMDSTTNGDPASYAMTGYALQCSSGASACDTTSGSNQYNSGPWDFLNSQSTWEQDVQLVSVKQRAQVAGDYVAAFRQFCF